MRMVLLLGLMCTVGSTAFAERHALLVGVAEVPALPQRLWLKGPDNDVTLMREVLQQHGFASTHITVLAQHAPGSAGQPSHAAITAAMQRLVQTTHAGDQVLLHLAGHGSQVPERADAAHLEPDGLDEVFLTEDVQRWDAHSQSLPNALMDHEIGRWINTLVDQGVQVWAIFDTCHAAGLSRDERSTTRQRAVSGSELGIPVNSISTFNATLKAPRWDGRVLAYAARGSEATTEEWLPKGAGLRQARLHGVFSYAVAQALLAGATSATTLGREVAAQYAHWGRLAPAPQVVGDGAALP